jgi:alpha-beta hydrolase superfamily lysophospholipase
MDIEEISGCIISIPFKHQKIDALFHHLVTHEEHVENKPIVLRLHGVLGNLLDETEHDLPQILAKHGYSSITMNTLLANLGLFFGFGIFDDAMGQIDAVCHYLREIGFKKIVIAGHGLGGCMAIRYGAIRNQISHNPDIQGIIGIATAYSLPDTIRKRWERFGSKPSYEEVYQRAKKIFGSGTEEGSRDDETFVVKRAHGHTDRPEHTEIFTLKTWWNLAGPEADGSKVYKHIVDIKVPLLLVHGTHDDMIDQAEFESLGTLARNAGNTDVTMLNLEAGHSLAGKHEELGWEMVKWMQDRFE